MLQEALYVVNCQGSKTHTFGVLCLMKHTQLMHSGQVGACLCTGEVAYRRCRVETLDVYFSGIRGEITCGKMQGCTILAKM